MVASKSLARRRLPHFMQSWLSTDDDVSPCPSHHESRRTQKNGTQKGGPAICCRAARHGRTALGAPSSPPRPGDLQAQPGRAVWPLPFTLTRLPGPLAVDQGHPHHLRRAVRHGHGWFLGWESRVPKWHGLTTTVDGVLRRRSRAFTPAAAALAAPTYTLTRPSALEWLAAHQATARLGDVSDFSCRLRIACHRTPPAKKS